MNRCKECHNQYCAELHRKPESKERHKRWKAKNKEKVRQQNRESIRRCRSTERGREKRRQYKRERGDFKLTATKRRHIESQLKPGWAWGNRGEVWHIDHIIPQKLFRTVPWLKNQDPHALHNLRPMLAQDNIKKSDKFVGTLPLL
jgi:hypothetical protein